jgi:hypothetical protein
MMRVGVALSVVVVGLSSSSLAFAQVTLEDAPTATPPAVVASPKPVADKPAESATATESAEERWRASLDAVFGFGSTPVVTQKIVGPLITQESRTAGQAAYATSSLNLGLDYEINKDLSAGVLLPIGFGSLSPDGGMRGSTVVGNFTLGGAYRVLARKDIAVWGGLDVALPTASGGELPDPSTVPTLGHFDQKQFDRRSLLQGMSNSRGREDTASFATGHLGLVPKVALVYTGMEKLELEGYAKYESLHATASEASYEGAVVVALRGSYRFHKNGDLTLRAWTNLPVAGPDSAVAAVEPQLRGHFGSFNPLLGVVLPLAGDLITPYSVGVRATLAANF